MKNARLRGSYFFIVLAILVNVEIPRSFAVDTSVVPSMRLSNTFGFDITDQNSYSGVAGSLLFTMPPMNFDQPISNSNFQRICSSLDVDICDPSKNILHAHAILNPCLGNFSQPCVESLSIADLSGHVYKLNYIRSVKAPTFIGSQLYGVPDGGAISLWHSDEIPGIKDFSVRYEIEYSYNKETDKKFVPIVVKASLFPYELRTEPMAREVSYAEVPLNDPLRNVTGGAIRTIEGAKPINFNCVWQETGVCAAEQEFEKGFRYSLTLAIPNNFSGWLQGRLISPDVTIEKISSDLNRLTVSSQAADVPRLVVDIDYSKKNSVSDGLFQGNNAYKQNIGFRAGLPADEITMTNYLDKFSEYINDKANLKSTKWSFKNYASLKNTSTNKCLSSTSQLMGMVTTNSLIYESGVPSFNNSTLEYKVAGLHFNPDGTIFKGAYDLLLRSEAARCLYNFSNAPISAEISVISADGSVQVTTTKISESNGWLHLGAYNFTFSNPLIQIRLTQNSALPTVTPIPEPVPTPDPGLNPVKEITKKSTITCVKGKVSKKVTAVSPKCPVGFKKK